MINSDSVGSISLNKHINITLSLCLLLIFFSTEQPVLTSRGTPRNASMHSDLALEFSAWSVLLLSASSSLPFSGFSSSSFPGPVSPQGSKLFLGPLLPLAPVSPQDSRLDVEAAIEGRKLIQLKSPLSKMSQKTQIQLFENISGHENTDRCILVYEKNHKYIKLKNIS